MKKLLIFFGIAITLLIPSFNVKAQPDIDLLNIKTLKYYEQTSDTHTVLFDTKIGDISNIASFYDNIYTYFNTQEVYFLPTQKGDYVIYNDNDIPIKTIYDFDYLSINHTDIFFYNDNNILYNTPLLNVKQINWEWDGVSYGAEYNNGYEDAITTFNERLQALEADYENKIDLIRDYYINAFEEAKEQYGMYYNGQWISAEQYGNIRYNAGASEDINVFQVLLNGFWSFLTVIGTFEILPGLKIIHFIALPLVFGVIFFITGKASK